MADHKLVKIMRPYGNLMPGDIAGFSPEFADRLVSRGTAEAYATREMTAEQAPLAEKGKAAGSGKKAAEKSE